MPKTKTKREAEILSHKSFILDGMVYKHGDGGQYFCVEQYKYPFITEELFERKFDEACEVVREQQQLHGWGCD